LRDQLTSRRRRASFGAACAITTGAILVGLPTPASAEFEIQETQVEKGEIEFEYRGAVHWGLKAEEAAEEDEQGGALEEQEEGEFLKQSHDFEFQWSFTDRWMLSTALSADEPLDQDFDLSTVEVEIQYEVIEREGNGLGLAFIGAYGFATRSGEADETEFAPFFELASGKFLFTGNPIFTAQVGDNRTTDSLGFEYGWRGAYSLSGRWGIGVEMFGEIEDLSNAGSFNDQTHSIGPTLFYHPGGVLEAVEDEEEDKAGGRHVEFFLNVGVQFGITDATSETALKFQGTLEF